MLPSPVTAPKRNIIQKFPKHSWPQNSKVSRKWFEKCWSVKAEMWVRTVLRRAEAEGLLEQTALEPGDRHLRLHPAPSPLTAVRGTCQNLKAAPLLRTWQPPLILATTPDPSLSTNNSSKPKKQKGMLPDLATPALSQENTVLHAEDKAPTGRGSRWGASSHPVSLAAEGLIRKTTTTWSLKLQDKNVQNLGPAEWAKHS